MVFVIPLIFKIYCYLIIKLSLQSVLGYEVRKKDAPHNCQDDACAAMKLVLAKIKDGHDDVIPMVDDNVSYMTL